MITKQVTEALKKEGLLTKKTFQALKEYQKLNQGNVLDFCVEQNIAPTDRLIPLLRQSYALPVVDLAQLEIDLGVAQLLPASLCFEHLLIPVHQDEENLFIAMANPASPELISFIERKINKRVQIYLAHQNMIKQTLELVFNNSPEDNNRNITELIKQAQRLAKTPEVMAKETPIIALLNQLIMFGLRSGASDLHIEPREKEVRIRFRIDGMLHELYTLPKDLIAPIIARLKILASLRIDEHLRPQDGRFTFTESGYYIAVRLAIIPTLHGPKASLRFLDTNNGQLSLNSLGLRPADHQKISRALGFSNGLILVTGPTGSGKTTTLYSMLQAITRKKVNISTIEDPIEYNLKEANQIQINPRVDLTFANGLRSILRQDPDIIMVGEIRDQETAQIAINAALTGHLVLSSLHTNSAAAAIPRLLDMGIEPFLVASTLRAVIGQRLVRKICPACKKEQTIEGLPNNFNIAQYSQSAKFAPDKNCPECLGTGYQGRIGIFEVMTVDESIHDLIINRNHSSAIEKAARQNGMKTLEDDGLEKVAAQTTSPEEIARVIK